MKLAIVLVGLSVAVMGVMIYQAVRQELNLSNLKASMLQNSAEIRREEEAIMKVKTKIQELKTSLSSVNANINELKKKKGDTMKSTQEFDKSLKTCNSEKENAAKRKTAVVESITKLSADHTEAKKKAGEEIQGLKQQIFDRDKNICAFADMAKEEARKLCGISEAPK